MLGKLENIYYLYGTLFYASHSPFMNGSDDQNWKYMCVKAMAIYFFKFTFYPTPNAMKHSLVQPPVDFLTLQFLHLISAIMSIWLTTNKLIKAEFDR